MAKDKLISPSAASFAPITMKRDTTTRGFVGRGEVTAPNPAGVPISHRFVCPTDPEKSAQAILRDGNPEMYAEVVRLFRL